jgi:hypothetical protein
MQKLITEKVNILHEEAKRREVEVVRNKQEVLQLTNAVKSMQIKENQNVLRIENFESDLLLMNKKLQEEKQKNEQLLLTYPERPLLIKNDSNVNEKGMRIENSARTQSELSALRGRIKTNAGVIERQAGEIEDKVYEIENLKRELLTIREVSHADQEKRDLVDKQINDLNEKRNKLEMLYDSLSKKAIGDLPAFKTNVMNEGKG